MAGSSLRISIEATVAPGVKEPRSVVYLHVNGYRFELEAPSGVRARAIVAEIVRALGLTQEDGDG